MKPNLSATVTMPSPAGGTKTNRPKIIAAVVRNPSFELPGPSMRLPPSASKMHGIIASPRIMQLSVKKYSGASGVKINLFKKGTQPSTIANTEAIMGGCTSCLSFNLSYMNIRNSFTVPLLETLAPPDPGS
uniref:Uncharacterized protein n=1 Tax=Opuntia streptacantha TaxID=393608 RepID=A0A7C9F0L9_OPUST